MIYAEHVPRNSNTKRMKNLFLLWVGLNLLIATIGFFIFKSKISKSQKDERDEDNERQFEEVEPSNFEDESGGRTDDY